MTQIVSSISGIEIYAPSAGNAPTNSADVSAIASGYQVVSATATQLYAGTAYLTSVNSTPVSASRAGNAANASLATSAWYDGTGRFISALPDSAAVSSIASGYASGKVDKSSISAQSSNWNSVYNTVSTNSASWSGSTGGGSVVSPSGTIIVMNGNQVEGTNSAVVVEQTSMGVTSTLSPQVNAIGPTGMGVLTYDYPPVSGMNLVFMLNNEYHGADATVVISGRDNNWNLASASGLIVEGDTSANIYLGTISSQLSASSDYWINLAYDQDLSAVRTPGYAVTGVGELAWNSALTGVSATVANNSASWGQGGVDSATVSSIASSYAESAASGVTDTVSSNSATWGQGGPVTSTASAAASSYTSTSTSVSSFTGVSSVNGSALLARTILPDAQQASGNAHFHFMPTATPWGSTEYTGVLSPLQYATGAALAMKQTKTYGAYYKGNEWFISDVGSSYTAANGVVRAELHRTRGIHLYGSSLNSATGFHLNGSGVDGKSGESAWWYGPTEYNMLTSVNDTVSANSASWGGGVDSATVSSIASSYAESAASGKMDSSAIDYTRTGDGTQIYASGTGSSTNQFSAYNDSAGAAIIAAKNARIRLWDTAATANIYASSVGEWNAASDLVSAQSANWGASALQIAAGAGIKLTKSGTVLFVENDVTVLYEAESVTNNTAGQVFTMSESVLNFSRLRITCENMEFPNRPFTQEYPVFNSSSTFVSPWQNGGTPPSLNIPYSQYSINGDGNLVCDKRGLLYGSLSNPQHTDGASRGYCLMKVEGLDRIYADYE